MTDRKPSFNRYVDMLKKALNIFKSNQDYKIFMKNVGMAMGYYFKTDNEGD